MGFLGSRDWQQSNCGVKILKVVEYREKSHPIKITNEDSWLKAMS